MGRKLRGQYQPGLRLLEQLYGVRTVVLTRDDGGKESLLCVPPAAVMEPAPIRRRVTSVGDGWLEAEGERFEGRVYVAAGVWSREFFPAVEVYGKAGASFAFEGEREGRIQAVGPGRHALAFVRDPGSTYFSDGTAEREYTPEHDLQTLRRAAVLGLTQDAIRRCLGWRPYTPGGPVFTRVGSRTWLATGGRKLGVILGASFARRLVEEELRL
jgi:hypothetical protein